LTHAIIAGRAGPAAILPGARSTVINAEEHVAIVAVRAITAGAGLEAEVESASPEPLRRLVAAHAGEASRKTIDEKTGSFVFRKAQ
jgi:hypothetical protein